MSWPDLSAITTNRGVKELARTLAQRAYRVRPESLGGTPIAYLEQIARSPASQGDRSVYILLSLDASKGRAGEGNVAQRLLDHYGAVISRLAPNAPIRWSVPQSLIDLLVGNDWRLPYVILAEGMSKANSVAGEQRIFDHFGIGPGSFLVNPWRR
jgi:hypothetical protein